MPVIGDQGTHGQDPWVSRKAATSTSSFLLPVKLEPDFVFDWEGNADLVIRKGFRRFFAVTGKCIVHSDKLFTANYQGYF